MSARPAGAKKGGAKFNAFLAEIQPGEGESRDSYLERVKERAQQESVDTLKQALMSLSDQTKFTYMRKNDLIASLVEVKKDTFVPVVPKPQPVKHSPVQAQQNRSAHKSELLLSNQSKKRKHHERDDADISNQILNQRQAASGALPTGKRTLPAFLQAREREASTKRVMPSFLKSPPVVDSGKSQAKQQADADILFSGLAQKMSKGPDESQSPANRLGLSEERQQMMERGKNQRGQRRTWGKPEQEPKVANTIKMKAVSGASSKSKRESQIFAGMESDSDEDSYVEPQPAPEQRSQAKAPKALEKGAKSPAKATQQRSTALPQPAQQPSVQMVPQDPASEDSEQRLQNERKGLRRLQEQLVRQEKERVTQQLQQAQQQQQLQAQNRARSNQTASFGNRSPAKSPELEPASPSEEQLNPSAGDTIQTIEIEEAINYVPPPSSLPPPQAPPTSNRNQRGQDRGSAAPPLTASRGGRPSNSGGGFSMRVQRNSMVDTSNNKHQYDRNLTMDDGRPSTSRQHGLVSQAFHDNDFHSQRQSILSKRSRTGRSELERSLQEHPFARPSLQKRDSLASSKSFRSATSFKSYASSNAPKHLMPLEKLAISAGSKAPVGDSDSKRSKMNKYGLGILLLAVIAAMLYPLKQAPPKLYCPSSFTQQLVDQLQDSKHICSLTREPTNQQKADFEQCKKFKSCISCPRFFGSCSDSGKLTCDTGFIEENHQCVENQIVREQALAILGNFQDQLQGQKGLYECGQADSATIQFDQFNEMLQSGAKKLYGNSHAIDGLVSKVVELLNQKRPDLDVHWRVAGSGSENEPYLTQGNLGKIEFYSEGRSMSLYCHARRIVVENLILIVFGTVTTGYLYRTVRNWQSNARVKHASKTLYTDLLFDLKRMGRGVAGISEAAIYDKFMSLQGHDYVRKDEQTFNSKIMPLLEGLRKGDKAIQTVQKVQFGRPQQVWQLR